MRLKLNLQHLYIVSMLILPIANKYLILPIAFEYCFYSFGLCIFLYYICSADLISVEKRKLIYLFYILFVFLILMFNQEGAETALILKRLLLFFLIFVNFYLLAYQIWDFSYGLKIYQSICVFVSILIILQFVLSIIGHSISLIPPGLISNTAERLSTDTIRAYQVAENRFSTFFLEPAHQSQYTVPCIAILLFSDLKNSDKRNFIFSLLMTVAVAATTSMQGILICGIIWSLYLYKLTVSLEGKKYVRLLFLIPLIIVVIIYFLQQPIIQYQITKKISSISNGNIQLGTSMYRRMKYGWDCFSQFDLLHKLFGCGYNNVGSYLYSSGIGLKYVTYDEIGYMSGLSQMFCELGIIGALLNFAITIFPIIKYRNKNEMILALLVCWFIIMLTSSSFDELASLLPLTMMLCFVKKEKITL